MSDALASRKWYLARQVAHWTAAALRLEDLEDFASPAAWKSLERYLRTSVRKHLSLACERLHREAALLRTALDASSSPADLERLRVQMQAFRKLYLRVETTLDFFGDTINTRTNPTLAGLLRACDTLAHRSMAQILDQLGKPTPVVLTYVDKGLGASILKAGLRLWDGTSENPVAAVKIVRHNLYRPTALIHETGHQVAHIAGWNVELAAALQDGLGDAPAGVPDAWSSWASEIAADAFAFVHTGYASIAGLHDVLAGEESFVLRHLLGAPHPIGYIRLLLGIQMCREFYGTGPWDDMAEAWTQHYRLERASPETATLLRASLPLLPKAVNLILREPVRAFGGRPLSALINPARVSPEALETMERTLGSALYTSMHWIWTEALRLLALNGLRAATMLDWAAETLKQQEQWMLRLGGALQTS
jgi:hypothetical protein